MNGGDARIRDTFNVLKARLEEDPALTGCVLDGLWNSDGEPRPDKYVSMFLDQGYRRQHRSTGPQDQALFTVVLHSTAVTRELAQLTADHVFAQMLGFVPVVPGRACKKLRHTASEPLGYDASILPAVYYAVDEFQFISDPA